jgi:hypothetical protein
MIRTYMEIHDRLEMPQCMGSLARYYPITVILRYTLVIEKKLQGS